MRQLTRIVCFGFLIISFYSCNDHEESSFSQREHELLKNRIDELKTKIDSLTVIVESLKPAKAAKTKKKTVTSKSSPATTNKAYSPELKLTEESNNWKSSNPSSLTYTPTKKEKTYTTRVGAICCDGTRSYATGRGACSHHGGVCEWLYQ